MAHFAVFDLGSNSARMSVWRIDGGEPTPVLKMKEMVRLSEDMGDERILREPAIVRTLAALKKFKDALNGYEDVTIKAYATAATRQARNQKLFLKRVQEEVGLTIEVIPGTKEAELDYMGVINTLPVQNALIIDTGGASTELILVQNRKMQNLISIPFGSVNLTERHLHSDPVKASELFNLMAHVNSTFNGIWWLRKAQNLPLIALGGSNRTLAKIERRKEHFKNFEDIHGYRMHTKEMNKIFAEILDADLEQRKAIPGLSKYRADIIVGGLIPVVTMMRYLDSDRLVFSQNGLREGALYEHLNGVQKVIGGATEVVE
ncbi:Ppx/GppA family phosphatase [Lacticaseibacillus sharpeae]|uniref:Exopolyphosphatase n=1 Tax=Lacticaseibacillus sharpeae JCM 1186 = DSM 20505 TaxID=1291052 RepID=A0A0R1ZUU8_9LACO|nr:Ppx/GppA family phosphatase [Lacticaseibacillus sharpeae]KRM55851.1 exopolyphosphatase [Lacticaseibacillus sharpeae JCM 1186 = DSM 20505]